MTKKIGVINNKGGPGKTTICYYLALHWATQGKRVTVIDLDGQGNLTDMIAPGVTHAGIADVLGNKLPLVDACMTVPVGDHLLQLVPASSDLYDVESDLGTGLGVMRFYNALRDCDELLGDVLIVDTPPHIGPITLSTIVAIGLLHGWLIAPTIPVRNSVNGIANIKKLIEEAQSMPGCRPDLLGVIATQVRGTNTHERWLTALRSDAYPPLLGQTPFRGGDTMDYELRQAYGPVADLIWLMTGGDGE